MFRLRSSVVIASLMPALLFATNARGQNAQITINESTTTPLPTGFSGVNMQLFDNGTSYLDPNMQSLARAMDLGWVRFPSGGADEAYDWVTGDTPDTWIQQFQSYPSQYTFLQHNATVIRGKGLIKLDDHASFVRAIGSNVGTIGVVNTFTDTPASAAQLVSYAQSHNIAVNVWELGNETSYFPAFYPDATTYLNDVKPFVAAMKAAVPSAKVAIWVESNISSSWNDAVAAYPDKFWDMIYFHYYPVPEGLPRINGLLLTETNSFVDSYLVPEFGPNTQAEVSEFNFGGGPYVDTLINAVYVAEYTTRLSSDPHVLWTGPHRLVASSTGGESAITSSIDHTQDCIDAYNNGTTIDTANLNFGYFVKPLGLALRVVDPAINSSTSTFATAVSGGATVSVGGVTGVTSMPALYAQAYLGADGTRYIVITNKSASSQTIQINDPTLLATATLNVTSLGNTSPTITNTSSNQNALQIQTSQSGNPITVGPYSITRVQWSSTVTLQASTYTLTYPDSGNLTATVSTTPSSVPTGQISIYDGSALLSTVPLQGNGSAYWYISPSLSMGMHALKAIYSGNGLYAGGSSPVVPITVKPAAVTLSPSCWNASFSYGGSYTCTLNLSSDAGSPTGTVNYMVDGTPNSVAINNGNAEFTVPKPNSGSHSVTLSYGAQGNFAAAGSVNESFTTTPASTQIQLTPSSYYQAAATPMTLTASLTSWSAGAPTDGTVVFYDKSTALGTVPAAAKVTFAAEGLSPGEHSFSAAYVTGSSGNYAPVTSPITVTELY